MFTVSELECSVLTMFTVSELACSVLTTFTVSELVCSVLAISAIVWLPHVVGALRTVKRIVTDVICNNMLTAEVGDCTICLEPPSLPVRLKTSCTCRTYMCLSHARQYLKSADDAKCAICRVDVLYSHREIGCRYDLQKSLWFMNDRITTPNLRVLSSKCCHCDKDCGTQARLAHHLAVLCPTVNTTHCRECGASMLRSEKGAHRCIEIEPESEAEGSEAEGPEVEGSEVEGSEDGWESEDTESEADSEAAMLGDTASRDGHVEIATALIAAVAEVNGADVDGGTLLHRDSVRRHLEIMAVLRART